MRERRPSFWKTRVRWVSIVFSLRNRRGADLAVGEAVGDELRDLALAGAERAEALVAGGGEIVEYEVARDQDGAQRQIQPVVELVGGEQLARGVVFPASGEHGAEDHARDGGRG